MNDNVGEGKQDSLKTGRKPNLQNPFELITIHAQRGQFKMDASHSFNAYRSGGGKTDSDLDEYAGRCTSACDALSADLFSGNDGNDAL